jgi:hypothetical protein
MLAVSSRSWKARQGTAIASTPALERFLRGMFARPAIRGMLDASVLEVGGIPVANHLCLVEDGCGYALMVEFDEAYAHLAPGRACVVRWLRECHERGLTRVDFLRETSLTSGFADQTYPIDRLVAFGRASPIWAIRQAEERLAWIGRESRRLRRQQRRQLAKEAS